MFLERQVPAEVLDGVLAKPFADRLALAGQYIVTDTKKAQAWAHFQAQVDPLRSVRNAIAHGYFQGTLRPSGEFVLGVVRARDAHRVFAPDTKHISFDELQRQTQRLTEATETFAALVDENRPT